MEDLGLDRGCLDLELGHPRDDGPPLARLVDPAEPREPGQDGVGLVVADRQHQHEPERLAVLGHIADAEADRRTRGPWGDPTAGQANLAARRSKEPEERLADARP